MFSLYIVDDELIIINGLKVLCDWSSMNIEIVGVTTNSRKAEEEIVRLNPDLAILDIRMPVRSGIDILHTIKSKKLKTKVVFLSAHAEFSYVRDALESGAFNYLIKPVNKEKLETVIKDAIDQIETETTANEAVAKVNRMEKDNLILRQKQGKAIINDLIQCQNNQVIKEIIIFMNNNFSQDISLDAMANKAKMNPYYFSVYFKKNSGLKFKDCLTRIRLEHAMLMLKQSDIKTWELAEKVGFTDPQYFSALFKKYFGKTPMEFKKE